MLIMTTSNLWELKPLQKRENCLPFMSFFLTNWVNLHSKSPKQILFVFLRSAGVKGQAVLAPTQNNNTTPANVYQDLRLPHIWLTLAIPLLLSVAPVTRHGRRYESKSPTHKLVLLTTFLHFSVLGWNNPTEQVLEGLAKRFTTMDWMLGVKQELKSFFFRSLLARILCGKKCEIISDK